ncbi:AraC family transcriptional regulator [Diaphorobacter caeni]|uniref:AraC family transcriptional regulator n=1 Tax=Diaphorobacter caeni TaxID=2784387 RepID=UPI001E448E65|nr:AraC family transcriptional regulator [Diaphorobacter caeni]
MQLEPQTLEWLARTPSLMEELFDGLPDVLFYIKDVQGCYLWANKTLIARSHISNRSDIIGKTADQLFPAAGSSTMAQDMDVLQTGRPIREVLRLYRTTKGERFWCLSSKFPLLDESRRVVGLAGMSRDLPRPNERHRSYHRLAKFLEFIDLRIDQPVKIADAAKHASVSIDTLGRLVLDVFHVTPKQLLMKKRIDKACQLLDETSLSITDISGECGYSDHSAFTRQFRIATHITPAQYRTLLKGVTHLHG